MKRYQDYAILLLRIAMAIGFLSAVSSRLSLLGKQTSGWENFIAYAEQVNYFLTKSFIARGVANNANKNASAPESNIPFIGG